MGWRYKQRKEPGDQGQRGSLQDRRFGDSQVQRLYHCLGGSVLWDFSVQENTFQTMQQNVPGGPSPPQGEHVLSRAVQTVLCRQNPWSSAGRRRGTFFLRSCEPPQGGDVPAPPLGVASGKSLEFPAGAVLTCKVRLRTGSPVSHCTGHWESSRGTEPGPHTTRCSGHWASSGASRTELGAGPEVFPIREDTLGPRQKFERRGGG